MEKKFRPQMIINRMTLKVKVYGYHHHYEWNREKKKVDIPETGLQKVRESKKFQANFLPWQFFGQPFTTTVIFVQNTVKTKKEKKKK